MTAVWFLVILLTTTNGATFSPLIGPYQTTEQCEYASAIIETTFASKFSDIYGQIGAMCVPVILKVSE